MTIVRKSVPPIIVNYLSQKRLSILAYWVNRRHRLAEDILITSFTPADLDTYGTMMNSEPDREITVKEPIEFKGNVKWKPWKEGVISYFNSVLTKDFIPLSYVIRENETPDPDVQYDNEHQRLVAIAPLRGNEYKTDNGVVFDFLKSWTINGPAYPWMKQFSSTRNGRAAWLAIIAYYEGSAARDRVKEAAYAAIANAKFSFRNQVRTDFAATVAHLATTIQMNSSITPDNRNVSGVSTDSGGKNKSQGGRGGKGRGRGRGRGHGGHGQRNIYLGTYSPAQWQALSADDKKRVAEGRKRSAEQQQAQGTGVAVSQVITTNQQDPQDVQSVITMGTQGQNSQRADTETAGSAMTRRHLMALMSGVRIPIASNRSVMQVQQTMESSTCELDSHADTCVAGPNCIIIERTGFTVNVTGFSNKQGSFQDVPIVKAATAYNDPKTGATYILVIGQAIYMGSDVEHTLLCPNQLRYNGVIVEECPKHLAPRSKPSNHAISVPEQGVTIPLKMAGTMSVFDSRTPTQEELESCMWVILTGDEIWDPKSETFAAEEEKIEYLEDSVFKR